MTSEMRLAAIGVGILALTMGTFAQQPRKWYEGGTLHKKTGADWLKASQENRLATAGDFLAVLTKPKSIAELNALEPKAANVVECVSTALERPKRMTQTKWQAVQDRPITEIVLPCIQLLGYR